MTYSMAIAIREKEKLKHQQEMENKYPQGIRLFGPKENAPSFVKGQMIITPKEFLEWIKANPDFLTEYKGEKQIRLQLLERKDGKGLNLVVDTYKPKEDGLPF
jgi:hypothetical protein